MSNYSAASDEQAFPVLDVSQIAKLRPFGRTLSACADEVLINRRKGRAIEHTRSLLLSCLYFVSAPVRA